MSKKNKDLPPIEQLKIAKRKSRGLMTGEIACAVAPLGVLTATDFEEFFIKTEVWRTSITFVMLIFSTLISVAIIVKNKFKINLLNALLVLGVVDGMLWFMGRLINELAYILLVVIFGFIGALALELKKKDEIDEIERLQKGIEKGETDEIAEKHKEYMAQQRVKIKIKNDK